MQGFLFAFLTLKADLAYDTDKNHEQEQNEQKKKKDNHRKAENITEAKCEAHRHPPLPSMGKTGGFFDMRWFP